MTRTEENRRIVCRLVLGILLLLAGCLGAQAQVKAYTVQNLSFGAFSPGSTGGTVTIAPGGTRSATGSVILVNQGGQAVSAIFEVEAPVGVLINIVKGPDTQLTGSNGGSMTLRIGNTDPAPPFISNAIAPARNVVRVGATLTVNGPASNPPGTYSGSFSVTFVQE